MSTTNLAAFVQQLSSKPGVYQMLNDKDKVIYVGKARNLKKRVSSYFRSHLSDKKTAVLMSQVTDIQVTITSSENQALLLEANLIKQLKPRYNILLRDDKSYPYLFLAMAHSFPRLDFHRGAKKNKGRYFGPYPSAGSVRENLALIQKLFKLRQCSDTFFSHRSRPCLQYQIKRCTAPCVGFVGELDYAAQVKQAILFLEGKNNTIINALTAEMTQASVDLEYEKAGQLRDQITQLRKLQQQGQGELGQGHIDIIGVAMEAQKAMVAVVFVRGGRLIGHKTFLPAVPDGASIEQVLMAFLPQYYLNAQHAEDRVQRVVLTDKLPEKEWIQAALSEQLGHKLVISDRKQAIYANWQRMAQTNAAYALSQHLVEKNSVLTKLEALRAVLKLPNSIQQIECFDISHTMGEATVASCVVYGIEGSLNKDYRRFNIKAIKGGDDYAAMRQVLLRRYTRLKEANAVLPDLIIIDGGKGQLRQAAEVMEELQISGVLLLGVAKGPSRKPGEEQLFIWGREQVMHLQPDSIALHLIQFIRDEAHRFAITGHRKARGQARSQSPLEGIAGVGAKRRQALLCHFGGLQELIKAGVVDIAKVSGISPSLAEKIYAVLHGEK